MKIYTLGAVAALLMSGPALAMEAPLMLGNMSASVEQSAPSHVDQHAHVDRMATASLGNMRMGGMSSANARDNRANSTPVFPWEYPGGR